MMRQCLLKHRSLLCGSETAAGTWARALAHPRSRPRDTAPGRDISHTSVSALPCKPALPTTWCWFLPHGRGQNPALTPLVLWAAGTAFGHLSCWYWDGDRRLQSFRWPLPSLGPCISRYHPESEEINWICILFFKYCQRNSLERFN